MSALENTLRPLAQAIVDRKDGYAMTGYPLRRALGSGRDEVVQILTSLVEELDATLTLCVPVDRLLYGYIQGLSAPVLLCKRDTTSPVADKSRILKAWYVMSGGLLPAASNCMPDTATQYIVQMNGR